MAKTKKETKEVKLKVYLLNHSVADTGDRCGCSRQSIHKAHAEGRPVVLLVNKSDPTDVLDAYEYKNKVRVFGFKG